MAGTAVKVTSTPWQALAEEAEILTDGGGGGALSGVTLNDTVLDEPVSSVAVIVTGKGAEPVTTVPATGDWL